MMTMDQDDLQLEGSKTTAPPDEAAPAVNSSSRVFDISDDNIVPISTDDLAKEPVTRESDLPPLRPIQEDIELEKRAAPPPEESLLDQKIGSFDATPFASPSSPRTSIPTHDDPVPKNKFQSGPIIVKSRSYIPIQKTEPQMVRPTSSGRSLQEEIAAALPSTLRPKQDNVPAKQPEPVVTTAPITNQSYPVSQPAQPASREVIKPVRTYEGDVAEAMSHKRTSTASIAIAESKKRGEAESISDEAPKHTGRKIFMLLVSLILLLGGAFAAYYLYSKSALAPVVPATQQQQAAPSIIPSSSQEVVIMDLQNPVITRGKINAEITKTQDPDSIREIVLASKDSAGVLRRVSAIDTISALEINMPDILSRSLTPDWMLGVYNDQSGSKSVFVVGTTNFFQNTFAGMLQWERVMADDLRQFLYPDSVEGVFNEPGRQSATTPNPLLNIDSILPSTSTTTATTTARSGSQATSTTSASSTIETAAPLRQYMTIRGKFEDRIVKNKDVRAFRTDTGAIIFLYSFIDSTHIVVTDKESTLAEILSRLEKQTFIR